MVVDWNIVCRCFSSLREQERVEWGQSLTQTVDQLILHQLLNLDYFKDRKRMTCKLRFSGFMIFGYCA